MGSAVIQDAFSNNGQSIAQMTDAICKAASRSDSSAFPIRIVGQSSVEGSTGYNLQLALRRAQALQVRLQETTGLSASMFEVVNSGEAWQDFRAHLQGALAKASDGDAFVPWLTDAIRIIDTEPNTEARNNKLRSANNGQTWDYIRHHVFPVLRTATYVSLPQTPKAIEKTELLDTLGTLETPDTPEMPETPDIPFYFSGSNPLVRISAEGLNVTGSKMTTSTGSNFRIEDIGGACVLVHDGNADPSLRNYFNYDPNGTSLGTAANHIYDLKFTTGEASDHSKWCMQPANKLGLYITTHSGGDEGTYGTTYNYSSLYLPFDIMLPEADATPQEGLDRERICWAFICDDENSPWSPPTNLHPKPIGRYNTGTYAGESRYVPAGTPVLLAMWDQEDYVRVELPSTSPGTPLLDDITYTYNDNGGVTCNNILTGSYLDENLGSGNDVFVFGMPINGTLNKAADFATSGEIDATLPSQANFGLGFYLNANPNKEAGLTINSWRRNNWYVLANRVYYRAPADPSPAPEWKGLDFMPVSFLDDELADDDEEDAEPARRYANRIYDMQGRLVGTEEMMRTGAWRNLTPGIYILNGKKFVKP